MFADPIIAGRVLESEYALGTSNLRDFGGFLTLEVLVEHWEASR